MPWDFWLLFLFLGIVLPLRGYLRLKRLLAAPAVSSKEKIALYLTTIAFQWFLVAFVAWRCHTRGLGFAALGVVPGRSSLATVAASVFGSAAFGCFHWLNLKRVARLQGPAPDFMKALASKLLPTARQELVPYLTLAITAGVCEEFLYRGFAIAALSQTGMATWLVVILTSLLFGLAHAYQGAGGVISTTALGLLFGVARIWMGTLVPVMAFHAVVDIVAGIAGPKYLLQVAGKE